MSAAIFRRAVVRAIPRARTFASEAVTEGGDYQARIAAQRAHAKETSELWRKVTIYVCVPAAITAGVWVQKVESEHEAHEEHLKHENDGHLPEVPAYDYLNKRVKPFPWGNNTLFFNPHKNKNMEEEA